MSWFGDVGGFLKGVGEGAWDGAKGTVQGVGQLAQGGYKLATDGQYRRQAWDAAVHDAKAAGNFAETAVTDPGEAAAEVGHAASGAWHVVHTAYDQAAAQGHGSEFVGKLFGQGAILVGTAFVPGGAEADALGAIGDAGRATTLISDAGKASELIGDAGKGADAARDAGRMTNTATHAEGEIDLGSAARDAEIGAPRIIHLGDADAFKAAAEHAAPNTTYEFGSDSWTTDAEGRTIQAEGEVELTPAGRDTGLQEKIGKEGAPSDVGFHLIGDRFNGPTNRLNVVAGNGKPLADGLPNLNQGACKRLENQVAHLASDPYNTAELRIQPRYSSGNLTTRPDGFSAAYRINCGDWIEREFVNKR
ncbi:MAG TPA: DNA/RNA non-specific endonuclease [Acetobacteraceae bacterium]|jgi:hypothetical protein|nr:DNA/RNA non-specific endonuclease [Acetobacteraceae bacterium]